MYHDRLPVHEYCNKPKYWLFICRFFTTHMWYFLEGRVKVNIYMILCIMVSLFSTLYSRLMFEWKQNNNSTSRSQKLVWSFLLKFIIKCSFPQLLAWRPLTFISNEYIKPLLIHQQNAKLNLTRSLVCLYTYVHV